MDRAYISLRHLAVTLAVSVAKTLLRRIRTQLCKQWHCAAGCLPKAWAVTPIVSVATLVLGGMRRAPLRRKFNKISNAKNQLITVYR